MLKRKLYIPKVTFFILIFCFGTIHKIESQERRNNPNFVSDNKGTYRYMSFKTHLGTHFYTGKSLDDELKGGYKSIEFRYAWQNRNPEHWTNKYYNGVSYGLGIYTAYIGTPGVVGTPTALFSFINFPHKNLSKRTRIITDGALGVLYDSNYYHATKNPKNDAIGSPFSIYVNIGLGFESILTRNVDLIYGLDYTHFSNGRLTVPNYGLNMLGVNLGLKYHYNRDAKYNDPYISQERFKRYPSLAAPKDIKQRINILTAFGTVQNGFQETVNESLETDRFYTFSGYIEYQLNFNVKHGLDAGLDLFYDGSLANIYTETKDRYLYAYHFGYNYTFGKMLLKLDLGGYMGPNGSKGKEDLWTRAALQYRLFDWFGFHLGLKTKQGFSADWAEFGLIFQPFKW